MAPEIRALSDRMFTALADAWHTAETAAALSVDARDELLDVAAWGAGEDEAFAVAIAALPALSGDDPPGVLPWRIHVTRSSGAIVAHVLWGSRVVGELRCSRDDLEGNLDVKKAEAARKLLEDRTATRLHALVGCCCTRP